MKFEDFVGRKTRQLEWVTFKHKTTGETVTIMIFAFTPVPKIPEIAIRKFRNIVGEQNEDEYEYLGTTYDPDR
jgi:hypothetical protein